MVWRLAHRADPLGAALADRHYNRQSVGSLHFVPPGACVVLVSVDATAVWVTSWPLAEYVRHAWAGAWVNSLFRKEGPGLASDMIRQAIAVTRWKWPTPPDLGMVTFVDAEKVRKKRDPGRCYLRAGFKRVGETQGGLLAFQILPDDMPDAEPPCWEQRELWA